MRGSTEATSLLKCTTCSAAAVHLGLRLHVLHAGTDAEIEAAFAGFAQLRAGVLLIGQTLFSMPSRLLAELSLRDPVTRAVPAMIE
jgi:hypothetical protein